MSEINPFEVDEPLIKKRAILGQSKSEDFDQSNEDTIVHDKISKPASYLRFVNLEEGNFSWRRLIARIIDIKLASLVVFIGFYLIAPQTISMLFLEHSRPEPMLSLSILILSGVFLAIFEAFSISYFSCTPGKWLCCIKIKDTEGKSLSLGAAFKRSFLVLAAGCAFYLPIISLFSFAKSAHDIREKSVTYWDNRCQTKIEVSKLGFFRVIIISALLFLFFMRY